MAALQDLLSQIQDEALRSRIEQEVDRLTKIKKFGLVYEHHLPENTALYDAPVRPGVFVAKREDLKVMYRVLKVADGVAICASEDGITHEFAIRDIVVMARSGDPIYPTLQSLGKVSTDPDSDLWHTLIEADNYHALQLLEYLYAGKVDCIYIDPPYNTGARDWKYNNDYVDASDQYRHSKWLSMMERRLRIAKRLLNPADSVLIVTIDEKEYVHLGALLEELFPNARIQMVSCNINPGGVSRHGEFGRTDEYIYFIKFGSSSPSPLQLSDEWLGTVKNTSRNYLHWDTLLRTGTNHMREDRPNLFFPILVDKTLRHFVDCGVSLSLDSDKEDYIAPEGTIPIFPMHKDGTEGCWGVNQDYIRSLHSKGYLKIGKPRNDSVSFSYLKAGNQQKVENGTFEVIGYNDDGSIIVNDDNYRASYIPGSQWMISSHDATRQGSGLLRKFVFEKRFDFPKSLYAVHDALRFFVADKPNALILDFFAGSGTTLHAVNLLNAEDGGKRRCIMVTNNEVSEEEERAMRAQGLWPDDEEWKAKGIARYVNWPRTVCSITGKDVNGNDIAGDYITTEKKQVSKKRKVVQWTYADGKTLTTKQKKEIVALLGKDKLPQSAIKEDTQYIASEEYPIAILFDDSVADDWLDALDGLDNIETLYILTQNNRLFRRLKTEIEESLGDIVSEEPMTRPMSEGFKANAEFFKLTFLDRNSISLGREFREILPLLWMKAGAKGERPELLGDELPEMLVYPQNRFAVLIDSDYFCEFEQAIKGQPIDVAYIISDSRNTFEAMAQSLDKVPTCIQLYRDYLDNFRITNSK